MGNRAPTIGPDTPVTGEGGRKKPPSRGIKPPVAGNRRLHCHHVMMGLQPVAKI